MLVEDLLYDGLSPDQISGRRRRQGMLRISHECIYQYVLDDKRAGGCLYLCMRQRTIMSTLRVRFTSRFIRPTLIKSALHFTLDVRRRAPGAEPKQGCTDCLSHFRVLAKFRECTLEERYIDRWLADLADSLGRFTCHGLVVACNDRAVRSQRPGFNTAEVGELRAADGGASPASDELSFGTRTKCVDH